MPRYRLTLEYDGEPFVGWQRQANGPSVQAALEAAIQRFCGEMVTIHAAGRTDAGVHAWGQVVHVDLARDWPCATVRDALNFHLRPWPVAVIVAEGAAPDFDARFSAQARVYRYRILNRVAPPVLDRGRVWHLAHPLDPRAMQAGAEVLIGRHDFTSFRGTGCQARSPLKTLDALNVTAAGEEIHVEARARSFLYHQVRIMVGTLRLCGDGKWRADDVARALAAADRKAAGPTAPPQGLYLVEVRY